MQEHGENFVVGIQAVAILSCFASFAVLFTLIIFRDMRSKLFMRIIAYISVSDMLGNFPYTLPYRPRHGPWCVMQGLLNTTFYPMSWLWTLALAYLLYYLATENRFPSPKVILSMNITCWCLPVFLTALSLSCTVYGYNTFGIYPFEVCIFKREINAVIFHGIFYYGLLVLCWVLMVAMKRRLVQMHAANSLSPSYEIAKTSLSLYPPALVICWFPHCVLFLVGFVVHERYGFYFMSDVLKLLHGVVTAAIFFYKSPESRRLWSRLFFIYIGSWFITSKPSIEENGNEDEWQIENDGPQEDGRPKSTRPMSTRSVSTRPTSTRSESRPVSTQVLNSLHADTEIELADYL